MLWRLFVCIHAWICFLSIHFQNKKKLSLSLTVAHFVFHCTGGAVIFPSKSRNNANRCKFLWREYFDFPLNQTKERVSIRRRHFLPWENTQWPQWTLPSRGTVNIDRVLIIQGFSFRWIFKISRPVFSLEPFSIIGNNVDIIACTGVPLEFINSRGLAT